MFLSSLFNNRNNRRKSLFFFSVIPIIFFPLIVFHQVYNYSTQVVQSSSGYVLSSREMSLIKDGDIILRHGYGFVSDMIVDIKNEKYKVSHCAIICKDSLTNEINVIHSVSQTLAPFDGVQIQPLKVFLNDCQKNSIIISRYKHTTKEKPLCEISKRAKYYLNKRVPFDNNFNLFDSTKIYCTELIYLVIKDVFGDDIFKYKSNKSTNDIDFMVFTDTTHFDVIINHHLRKDN
ncbi:MAG TPA: YiiX/YebB-like N1pC/P60 family cysteine hydrolase [Bacteroidales bacterium]|nr:YiiX/YebB-like N1pC/P60 family cysteine hydrolase [Bacteroidales bacterium]